MTDVLERALRHREELQDEITRLEDFIRTAQELVQRTGRKASPPSSLFAPVPAATTKASTPQRPANVPTSLFAPVPVQAATAPHEPTLVLAPDLEDEQREMPRPWANQHTHRRPDGDGDDRGGPSRRNLMRR